MQSELGRAPEHGRRNIKFSSRCAFAVSLVLDETMCINKALHLHKETEGRFSAPLTEGMRASLLENTIQCCAYIPSQ